ncbi:MAG: DUF4838 domain-containing protein [bacterium]
MMKRKMLSDCVFGYRFGSGVLVLTVVAVLAGPVWPEIPVYRAEPSGEYLRTWLLCGPFLLESAGEQEPDTVHLPGFENDFLKNHGGELDPRITEGQVEKYDGGSATWLLHTSENSEINLDEALSDKSNALAYGYCEIDSPRDEPCVLALGSNDGVQARLNGEIVWDVTKGRALQADSDLIPILLRKGRNSLLLKVEERGGSWGFACRLLSFNNPMVTPDRLKLFHVINREDGTPVLQALSPIFKGIVKKVTLEAAAVTSPDEIAWSTEWKAGDEIVIAVDSSQYGEFILRIHSAFTDDVSHTFVLPFSAGKRIEHTLFADKTTDYSIILGDDASESEKWAASELRDSLMAVSGADFPIRHDSDASSDREIVVGFNSRAKNLLGPDIEQPADEDESFQYRNVGSSIVIWGGRERGTMYGVMTFLERELGCRWYAPRVSVAPKKEFYRFHYLRHAESPGIRVRNVFFYEAFDPVWAARNKSNGLLTFGGVREQIGGLESYWAVHTFNRFVPPEEFYEKHPEYYSLIDRERVCEHSQLCITNPEVKRIIKERVLNFMREHPEHRIYSVSQNDGYGPCQCEKCQAVVKREGSESGPILELVNEIAEAAEREFPDKFIGTLAYVYSRKPPKNLRPRQNVVIRLCSFECCRGHDFYSCPKNASFLEDIEGWSAIAPHLYIWDYVVEFSHYLMPYPNFKAFQRNIQCFRKNNAIGIMTQGSYQSRGGEFAELRMYVLSKLLWNPDCDMDKVIDDFMYGYYGRSGQYVRAYFDLLHNRVTPEVHVHHFNPDVPFFSDELVSQAEAIFDQAEIVADNEEIRKRVEMARLSIMYLKCKRTPIQAKQDGTYARFCEIVEREGITHYSERGAPDREAFHESMEAVR